MITADLIAYQFKVNHHVLHRQIEGLTHEDSLCQPSFGGNCLNWVLGHIVASRNGVLAHLKAEPIWDEATKQPYIPNSEPITNANSPHLPFEQIIAALDESQQRLVAALDTISQAHLNSLPSGEDRTVGEQLTFLFWHEAYHVGQTEYLRQLAGKSDKLI